MIALALLLGAALQLSSPPVAPEAFRLSERDLIPEGIAYDPVGRKFYLSSVHKAKIVEVDASMGLARDFIGEREHGFLGGVGLAVDAENRRLFAASAVTNQVRGFTREDEGRSGLFVFSLDDGSLLADYILDHSEGPHLLNDLTLDGDGSVYVTDTLSAAVYVLRPRATALDVLVRDDDIRYPNGVTLWSPGVLLVANERGIAVVRVAKGTVEPLNAPESIRTMGIDGLYAYGGAVLAVQNHRGLNRVVRFDLDVERGRVLGEEVLAEDHPRFDVPTTGALVGDELFVVANSQLARFDADGRLPSIDELREPVVLRLELR